MNVSENFRPVSNFAPRNRLWSVLYALRRILDFQLLTIYREISVYLKSVKGSVLDVGCGDCAYKYLLKNKTDYIGIDIFNADSFDYTSDDSIIRFDGHTIPLPDSAVDHIICSEVLEHVSEPQGLLQQMHRVLKPGGDVFVTIPWSARFHYIPHDYARYTPSKLQELFKAFEIKAITARGTDITVVCNKLIVMMARSVSSNGKIAYWKLPILLLLSPILGGAVLWAHCSLWFSLGSQDDPLGYTLYLRKPLSDTIRPQ